MSGISIKNVCCTCLSSDRQIRQLFRIPDGINLLYMLLSLDPEAYKQGFYRDTSSLQICWECLAVINKIKKFRKQACVAQKMLTSVEDGQNNIKPQTLSNLKIIQNGRPYCEFKYNYPNTEENFIDCGLVEEMEIKIESDDDIPLSSYRQKFTNDYDGNDDNFDSDKSSKTNKDRQDENIFLRNSYIPNRCSKDENAQENDLKHLRRNIRSTSKKRDKVKYSKYFKKIATTNEELVQNVEKRKRDTESDAYKCDKCFLTFKNDGEVMKHMERLHSKVSKKRRKSSLGEPKYPCSECEKQFQNKNLRWKHVQKAHREGFACSVCQKKFAFKNNLERHERIHSSQQPRQECQVCHKLVRVDLARVHADTHTDRQTRECVECDKKFVSQATYRSHLKYARAHASRDARRFVSQATYRSHLKYARAHARQDARRHKCDVCEKRYRSRGELQDHMNYQHKGQAVHKCPICGKGLATKRCIGRHVRRAHEGVKENARDKICQQCGKAFRDKMTLLEHERIHSGDRPLACGTCGRAFRQRAALYKHTARVHHNKVI